MQVGEVLGYGKNEDQLHPLRRLEVLSAGHLNPTSRPQVLLAKH